MWIPVTVFSGGKTLLIRDPELAFDLRAIAKIDGVSGDTKSQGPGNTSEGPQN
jgi:hypothetical protein